jgi:RNA polymerase sigma factor (sigma-70 family)
MESKEGTVLLIDDDPDVREAVDRLLRSAGWKTEVFASASEFLARQPIQGTGCIVLDICMPGMTGPQLHEQMREQQMSWPVIYLSGQCDVAVGVNAMKHGAIDVLEKPADEDVLLEAIAGAVERHRRLRERCTSDNDIKSRLASLSPREREVLDCVVQGRLNKQIAATLGIAEKTVKVHRGRAMAKMKVRSVAEVVHLWDQVMDEPAVPA